MHSDFAASASSVASTASFLDAPPPSSSTSTSTSTSVVAAGVGENVFGDGVFYGDDELVQLLALPPKSVAALRTKSGFQEFFRGMRAARMQGLLERGLAATIEDAQERASKVKKRMDLVRDVLT
jgi:hypothetical protein